MNEKILMIKVPNQRTGANNEGASLSIHNSTVGFSLVPLLRLSISVGGTSHLTTNWRDEGILTGC